MTNLSGFDTSNVHDAPLLQNNTTPPRKKNHLHLSNPKNGRLTSLPGKKPVVTTTPRTEKNTTTVRTDPTDNNTPPRPHPHAGARDVDGSWGYIADVTLVRRFVSARYHKLQNSIFRHSTLESHLYLRDDRELESACNAKPREGKERKAGWRLLTQKVLVDGPDPKPISETDHTYPYASTSSQVVPSKHTPRILCAIYTYEKRQEMATTIADTWGWKCDGFFAASTKTIHEEFDPDVSTKEVNGLGSVDLPHLGPEQYENMWQKTRSILAYMHDNYLESFDFFFLSGDDTYLIVENLRRTLISMGDDAWEYPLYLGHWIPYGSNGSYFCGGGPGYVLNRKSLELLVKHVFPSCKADLKSSSEDRLLGQCLQTIGVVGNHSVDALGAQRFHGMDPHDTCTMKGESGFFGMLYRFWGEHYGFRTGFNLTSSQSVSFHKLTTSRHLKRIHAILYKSCPPNTTIGDILGRPSLS